MADNTTINSGAGGDVIATDDIDGVKYQRVKVTFGADGSATDVSPAAPLPVVEDPASAAATTAVASSSTAVDLLAANAARAGATVYNAADTDLFIRLGGTATLGVYGVRVPPNGYYETPYRYTGLLSGIWSGTPTGDALVTELS